MSIPRANGAVKCGLFGSLVVCALALAPSQPPQLDVDDVRAKIRKAVADGTTPSLAVAVARGGRILWSEGFGFAVPVGMYSKRNSVLSELRGRW